MQRALFSSRFPLFQRTAFYFFLLLATPVLWISAERFHGSDQVYSDAIKMASNHAPGKTKMPPVWFSHDAHTTRLVSEGCIQCHRKQEYQWVYSFKNSDELSVDAADALYHEQCSGCHAEMKSESKKTGPLENFCRECHREGPEITTENEEWHPIVLNKSLHYRHIKAKAITGDATTPDKNCSACHHVYDTETDKIVYQEGKEGACIYCHKHEKTDVARSWQSAAHDTCVTCHLNLMEKTEKTGPVECAGCHSKRGLAEISIAGQVPRLDANQPNAVFMASWMENGKLTELPKQFVFSVVFNHLDHESAVETCSNCHHASLEPCRKCHTRKATEKGGFFTLMSAMHAADSHASCTGCHARMQQKADCAGCHAVMTVEKPLGQSQCRQCHSIDPKQLTPLPLADRQQKQLIQKEISARTNDGRNVWQNRGPREVRIDELVDVYHAAVFPHEKMVNALHEKTKDNRLASHFHEKPETLCMGCHHYAPASAFPPACMNCHDVGARQPGSERPQLKEAYHGQCIGCHERMNIKEPAANDCAACHKPRDNTKAEMATIMEKG